MEQLYILEGTAKRKRRAKKVKCDYCGKEFLKAVKHITEKNYCCRNHSDLGKRKRVKVKCALCGKEFEKKASELNNSKSGLYFCCRKHKDLGQRIENNLKNIWPDHYGNLYGTTNYRRLALENYEHKCENCEWDKYPDLLQVHHIDSDRQNNKLENLIILCPTCHWALTLKKAKLENRKWIYLN